MKRKKQGKLKRRRHVCLLERGDGKNKEEGTLEETEIVSCVCRLPPLVHHS